MNDKHKADWDEIIRLLTKNELYNDVHKFYSTKQGWIRLTDKLGARYEIVYGNTVKFFRDTIHHVMTVNNYTPHWQRKLSRYVQTYQ